MTHPPDEAVRGVLGPEAAVHGVHTVLQREGGQEGAQREGRRRERERVGGLRGMRRDKESMSE